MKINIAGNTITIDPRQSIGKGGEADIYRLKGGKALKVFKAPEHPDFAGLPEEQDAARKRLGIHQCKLPAFPKNLPEKVIAPDDLAYNPDDGTIIGYTMKLLDGAEVLWRFSSRTSTPRGYDRNGAVSVLADLRSTLFRIHEKGIVIGDFNDLNVLVKGNDAWLIDADSFQFNRFLCLVFTTRFLDPLLCNASSNELTLTTNFTSESDWYAFAVMVMQTLLFVGPYGGIYNPSDPSQRMSHELRPLNRITVFHPDVKYPVSALHYSVLPDEMLDWLQKVFIHDRRAVMPGEILSSMRWTTCLKCGCEHSRPLCPQCSSAGAAQKRTVTSIKGDVTITRLFRTEGAIVKASPHHGRLLWLAREENSFTREDGTTVFTGALTQSMSFGLMGDRTVVADRGRLVELRPGVASRSVQIDDFIDRPAFDVSEDKLFYCSRGRLYRSGDLGEALIGEVLEGQTFFKAGPGFGFGYYRAGHITVSFLFSASKNGINDSLSLPALRHQVLDTICCFNGERCWLFISTQERGHTIHRCYVIKSDGSLEASLEAERGDGSWLGAPLHAGKFAFRDFLLLATDDGLARIEIHNGFPVKVKEFADTSRVVNGDSQIYPGNGGLFVVSEKEVNFIMLH
jgi:H/ACA ribonucleoprotein complex subunit 3